MRWNDDILRQIEDRIDIVELVSETTDLKRKGGRYWGLCPFHQEKTPSFSVDRERGLYYCFGCKKGGNIFTFVTSTRGLSFSEAVEYLAARANVQLLAGNVRPDEVDQKKRLVEVNEIANRFFMEKLAEPQGSAAREYAEKRGISLEASRLFQLGYAPDGWNALTEYLLDRGMSSDLLKESGLIKKAATGDRYFDLFRNRLMFPIFDNRGQIVAFGGRALGDEQPKYLNSPETVVYSKRHHLFGLYQAKEEIRRQDMAILVEGYMDCLKMHQKGITNAVASLGTSLTEEQARLLARYASGVTVIYDGDESGQRETLRALEVLGKTGLRAHVVTLEGAKDPDEFLERYGEKEFLALIKNNKVSPVEFKLRRAVAVYGISDWQQKAKVLREVYPEIERQDTELDRERSLELAARYTDLPERMVRKDYLSWQRTRQNTNNRNRYVLFRDNIYSKDSSQSDRILGRMLTDPELLTMVCGTIGTGWVRDPKARLVVKTALKLAQEEGSLEKLPHYLETEDLKAVYARLVMQDGAVSDEEVKSFMRRVVMKRQELRWQSLSRELHGLESDGDFYSLLIYIIKVNYHLKMSRKGG